MAKIKPNLSKKPKKSSNWEIVDIPIAQTGTKTGYSWSTNTSQTPKQQVVNTENVNTTKTQTKEVKPSFINTLIDYNLHPKENQSLEETLMTDAVAIAPFFKDFPGYKKLAYTMASQDSEATRNPIDIWGGSGQYDGTWKYEEPFDEKYPYDRNLLKNYIYGDTSGFEKNNLPPIRLDRFQKKYGDIPSYDMYSNVSKKDSININDIFKTSELRDKLNFPIKKEFLDDLFKKNNDTIPIPFEEINPYHTTDDVAGHMGYLMRNPKNNDEINFRIQDIWKFDPDDYSKKWTNDREEIETYVQAKAMEASGKPFILSRQNPVKFPNTKETKTKEQRQLENDLAGEDAFFNSVKKQKNGGKINPNWEIMQEGGDVMSNIDLHLPKYPIKEKQNVYARPYIFGLSPAKDINVYGAGANFGLNFLDNSRNTFGVTGGVNNTAVSSPGGFEISSDPYRSLGLRYVHRFKEGGNIQDQQGYLASNLQNFTPKKVIKGNKKGTNITTADMAFPITANGKTLFPNTGEYYFPESSVTEYPIMQTGGRPPLKILDPREFKRREQAYNDSLNLFLSSEKQKEALRSTGYNPLGNTPWSGGIASHPTIKPVQEEAWGKNGITSTWIDVYEKPVQPVVYEPRPIQTPIQLDREEGLLESNPINLGDINPIPFESGSYFTRKRKPQEADRGKMEYFDKKTGRSIGLYDDGGELPEAGSGYKVVRSSERKGKTHKVTGPDGTVKFFGDSKLGQHPKDPARKKAFYARHKKNLAGNPYFRAFARKTWEEGGELNEWEILDTAQDGKKTYKKIKKQEPSFFYSALDYLLPGTPVEDSYKIYNTFADLVNKRIENNKKNNLPLDKMTPEEIQFRENVSQGTPDFGYPSIFDYGKISESILKGKKYNESAPDEKTKSRRELKKMWLGIDEPDGKNKGYWIQSEYKPAKSTNSNAFYYKPKDIPNFSNEEFEKLYNLTNKFNFPGNAQNILNAIFPKGKSDYSSSDISLGRFLSGWGGNQLGNFKLGAGEDEKGKYVSVYDVWDLFPPQLKDKGIDIQQFGNSPEIYYRIYQPEHNSPYKEQKSFPGQSVPTMDFAQGGMLPDLMEMAFGGNLILEKYQEGGQKDIYKRPILSKIEEDPNINRSYYDPKLDIIYAGADYAKMTPEQKNKLLAHENYHAYQFKNDKATYLPVKDIPFAKPSMVSTPEIWNSYYNRKPIEVETDIYNFKSVNPSFQFVPENLIFDKVVDPGQYGNPYTMEGEADFYENTGKDFMKNGGSVWEILPEAGDGLITLSPQEIYNPSINDSNQGIISEMKTRTDVKKIQEEKAKEKAILDLKDKKIRSKEYNKPDIQSKYLESLNKQGNEQKKKDLNDIIFEYENADNNKIKDLQNKLTSEGYNLGKYGADGKFGEFTKNAIISKFENDSLDKSLIDKYYKKFDEENVKNVKQIQEKLFNEGYLKGNPLVQIDGKFGDETKQALEKYNKVKDPNAFFFTNIPKKVDVEECAKGMCKVLEMNDIMTDALGVKYKNAWDIFENMNSKKNSASVYNIYDDSRFKNIKNKEELVDLTKTVKQESQTTPDMYKSGDIVGIFWPGSEHHEETLKSKTHNTHVGFVSSVENGVPMITHNVFGNIKTEPFNKLNTTWIQRPNQNVKFNEKYNPEVKTRDNSKIIENYEKRFNAKITPERKKQLSSILNIAYNDSQNLPKLLNSDVDPEWLESAVVGITGVETGIGKEVPRTKEDKDLKNKAGYVLKNIKDEDISLGISKTKFNTLDNFSKSYFNIKDVNDLGNDEKLLHATTYNIIKYYDTFKDYANKFPEMQLTEQDVRDMAILAHNRGDKKLLSLGRRSNDPNDKTYYEDSKGLNFKEEVEKLRDITKRGATQNDKSSTLWRYAPNLVTDPMDFTSETYVSKVKNYQKDLYNRSFKNGGNVWEIIPNNEWEIIK
jgi:hypothetical protein